MLALKNIELTARKAEADGVLLKVRPQTILSLIERVRFQKIENGSEKEILREIASTEL